MPQAARAAGRSPGHARRDRERAGGTARKASVRRPTGLVRGYQKNRVLVMRFLHAEQRLDPQRYRQVQARLGIFQVQPRDLADAVEAVAERVGMDAQPLRGVLLLACLEVGAQGRDQGALTSAVVLDQRPEMATAVVDKALIAHRGQKPGQPELGHGYDLSPSLEPRERLHHRGDLAQSAL